MKTKRAGFLCDGQSGNLTFYPVIYGADVWTDSAGSIKADQSKSMEKIDESIAMVMALNRAVRCENEKEESVYDSRGFLVF